MIDTDKYEGHTPANEWRMVFSEAPWGRDKQMLGLKVEAYRLGQMQACDPEDYRIAQANQDLAREAPLLLEEVKRLREQLAKANKYVHSICQHSESMMMDYEDYMNGDD